jgi:RNA polymerase sigma-70 factor (ECF subfamily)
MMGETSSTDENLMKAYQNGSEDAFRLLFERHSGRVYGFLLARLKDRAQADDVFQNTFLKLHQTRSHYDPAFPFAPWLFTVCKSVMVDYVRKQKRVLEDDLDEKQLVVPDTVPNFQIDLSDLPPQQQQVIDLRFREDLDFDEIAKRLETSPTNARQLLSRGIKRLRILASGEKK